MSSKIAVLEPHVANQIAAGEVIERPASVVKELIENAIDAKSTKIVIEIWQGGMEAIKVTDNGEGMNRDDLELAFLRHATSKIRSEKDLYHVTTLGFRGEALPSIAAVSQIEVHTRPREELVGNRLVLEGGLTQALEPVGCPPGTQIWVRNIFYNTPARKKFLKSPIKENSLIINVVSRLALANPHIVFKLLVDGKVVLQTSGNNDLLDAVGSVYTVEIAKKLIPVEQSFGKIKISGLISQCHLHKTSREMQNFFINNRYIHHLRLAKALETGYEDKLPKNRYPVCILNITIPADQLDVNVHPTKLEVRINKEEELCNRLTKLVADSLKTFNPVKEVTIKTEPAFCLQNPPEQLNLKLPEITREFTVKEHGKELPFVLKDEKFLYTNNRRQDGSVSEIADNSKTVRETKQKEFPELIPIGQLHNSYILAQGELGLYIIDQHAAHERIYYEEFKKNYQQGFYSQMLAVPISIELTSFEVEKLIDNILLFNNLGIIIEQFGDNTFILRGLPQGFSAQDGQDLVSYLVSELDLTKVEKLVREDYIKLLACKKAIKANQKLSQTEMIELISKLSKTDFPYTCPHGRPTIITFSKRELEQKFLRG